ncbi:MAG: dephospho-CoA kinase, partial [Thermoplasmata archaeon]|nr:dephospho-CoA kinase [Thermoplasmata archaeon]
VAIGGFADDQRKLHGDDVWAMRALEKLPGGDCVIDGSRSMTEIDCFRNAIGTGLVVLAIEAPEDQRFHRLRLRAREDDPMTVEDFARRDEREISWGIPEAIAGADLRLTNDAGLDEFRGKCLDALENIASSVRKNL